MDLGGVGVHGRGASGGGSGDEGVATADAAVWWGRKAAVVAAAAASASADVMNQLCRVCGEPAAGFHFGAFTCEGCKSFFGRTYSNLSSISECKNNGECVINKKNRTSCKACRLRKCLLVGMSKSGSRYGRRSNWFKIHCLLQEQQQQQQQATAAGTAAGSALASAKGLWPSKSDGESAKGYQPEVKTASPSPQQAPPPSLPQPLAMGGFPDAATASAAAFWAQARGSLLQLPTPHISGLHVPFLTPPFLHGAGFSPYQHKGFLLPFLPAGAATTSAATPPRPSRPASSEKRDLPAPALGNRRPSTSSSEGDSPPPGPTLPTPPAPAARAPTPATASAPAAGTTAAAAAAAAAALAIESLRALGPMQDTPLDLSFTGGYTSAEGASSDCGAASDETENDSGEDDDRDSCEDDEQFEDMDASEERPPSGEVLDGTATVKRTTPLDLTTHA